MGAIVAIVGEPGDPELKVRLDRMLARSPYRGEPVSHVEQGVAMGVQSLGSDASLATAGRWTVAVHGYMGNWPDPAFAHGLDLPSGADLATFLAVAVERVGDTLFGRLRGEYSVLLYDRHERRLLAVRDPLGCRPLFVESSHGRTYMATEIRQVLAGSGSAPAIDPDGLVQDLLWSYADRERSHFHGVARLLPGRRYRVALADSRRLHVEAPLWYPPAEPQRQSYDSDRLARELRGLIDQALDRSLPSQPFGVAMSGGLDSSSLWCLIADRARRGDPRAAGGHPYSFVMPGLDCDESARIRLVHEATSTAGTLVDGSDESLGSSLEELARDVDGIHLGSLFLPRMIARVAQSDGRAAMLLGVGGDEWLYGKLTYLADELRRGRLHRYLLDLWTFREGDEIAPWQMLLGFTLAVPWRRLRRALTPPQRPRWLHASRPLPSFDLDGRLAAANGDPPVSRARRALVATLLGVQDLHQRDTEEQLFARHGLEQRLPLMDLDVAEFVFQSPPRAMTDGRRPKDLLRRALGDLLPPAIRDGHAYVHYEAAICRDLEAIRTVMPPRQWWLVEAEIVDADGLEEMFSTAGRPGTARSTLPSLVVAEALARSL